MQYANIPTVESRKFKSSGLQVLFQIISCLNYREVDIKNI